jgi:hypothetical protein
LILSARQLQVLIVSDPVAFSVGCGRAEVTNIQFPEAPISLRVEVKLALYLIKHYAMKTYRGVDV